MKLIKKNQEPKSLTFYKQKYKTSACYEDLDKQTKDDLKQSLLEEQGYICCYCMRRISADRMRIEHWKPQTDILLQLNLILGLEYTNLLGACQGGEDGLKSQYHCDKSKGNKLITIHPQAKINLPLQQGEAMGISCETLVKFNLGSGIVYSENETINQEINDILCLNNQNLREGRRTVIQEFKKFLDKKYSNSLKKENLEKILKIWSEKSDGKYKEYCQVIITYLEKRLKHFK